MTFLNIYCRKGFLSVGECTANLIQLYASSAHKHKTAGIIGKYMDFYELKKL